MVYFFLVQVLSTEYRSAVPLAFPSSAAHTAKVERTMPTNSVVRRMAQKSCMADGGELELPSLTASHCTSKPSFSSVSKYSWEAFLPGNRVAMAIDFFWVELLLEG